jgi:23S rRNA pseudouridine1911/1915/1917 synthase
VLPQPDPTVEFVVVYEDEHLIVVDKPAGLVVHPGAGNPGGTLVNGLLARFPEIAVVGEAHRPGIVHRLDLGTSGLLAVARTQRAYHELVDALASRDVGRVYRALVWGHPANPHGVVDAPIGRDHRDPQRMAVVVDGRPARTRYQVLHEYRRPTDASALECRLESGRTHQIRVHLSAIGHPVVGDPTYGGVRSGIMPSRPFLHAARLELAHPVTREPLAFDSALPADLAEIEAALEP